MPMIIGVALFTLVLLVPRIVGRWRSAEGRNERGLLIALGAGPFALGVVAFGLVWALNPLNVETGALTIGELAGLVIGAAASITAIVFTTTWKPRGEPPAPE